MTSEPAKLEYEKPQVRARNLRQARRRFWQRVWPRVGQAVLWAVLGGFVLWVILALVQQVRTADGTAHLH